MSKLKPLVLALLTLTVLAACSPQGTTTSSSSWDSATWDHATWQ